MTARTQIFMEGVCAKKAKQFFHITVPVVILDNCPTMAINGWQWLSTFFLQVLSNYCIFCQFRSSKLSVTHTIAIKWKEKYNAVLVDCHNSLCLCGDSMKISLPKKITFFMETPTSPWVPFSVKFRPLGRLFCPSCPQAYSLVLLFAL